MKNENALPVTEDELDNIDVTISTDEGDIECKLLSVFTVQKRDYCAVMPRDRDGSVNPEGTVYLYRYHEDDRGIPSVEYISDDAEYEAVSARFEELLED